MAVVHIPAPSCALADLPFSHGLCLPATYFPRVLWVPSSQPVSLVGQMAFFGNAWEGCVRGCGMGVVHIPAPSCALSEISFSLGLCLPAACFPPVSFFLRRSP